MKLILLKPGLDYPNTYRNFVEMFSDDAACSAYLAKLRWSEGFVCPACKTNSPPWHASRGRLTCQFCRHQTSVTAGTIFDKTRTPLTTWLEAAWHVSTAKNGMSAKTLARTLGTKIELRGPCYSDFVWPWSTPNANSFLATLKLMKPSSVASSRAANKAVAPLKVSWQLP